MYTNDGTFTEHDIILQIVLWQSESLVKEICMSGHFDIFSTIHLLTEVFHADCSSLIKTVFIPLIQQFIICVILPKSMMHHAAICMFICKV